MDPFSITAGSVGLAAAALKATNSITHFVTTVRSAKADLAGVQGELIALQDVLEGIQQNCSTVESAVTSASEERIEQLMHNCHGIIDRIETLLQQHQSARIGPLIKWTLNGREDARKLRDELEAHRDALSIALDLAHLEVSQSISRDTGCLLLDTGVIRTNTEQIMYKLEYLHDRMLRGQMGGSTLERYLDEMTDCAVSVAGDMRRKRRAPQDRQTDVEALSTLGRSISGGDDDFEPNAALIEPLQEQSWFDRMRSYQDALDTQNLRAAADRVRTQNTLLAFSPLALTVILFILPENMVPFRRNAQSFLFVCIIMVILVHLIANIDQCMASFDSWRIHFTEKLRELCIEPLGMLLTRNRHVRADAEMAMFEDSEVAASRAQIHESAGS